MATIQAGIVARLTGDATLMALLTGGVWDRKIARNTASGPIPTPGSTPEAFDTNGRIKPCAYVPAANEVENPLAVPGAMMAFPQIWIRCLPRASDKAIIDSAFWRIRELLHGHNLTLHYGTGCKLKCLGRTGAGDDLVELPGTVIDLVRYQGDGIWSIS